MTLLFIMNSYNLCNRNTEYHVPARATFDRELSLAPYPDVPAVPVRVKKRKIVILYNGVM
jgi:hypothetical protein